MVRHVRRFFLIAPLFLVALLLLSTGALADVITLTSTADFDAGTKTSIETSSDTCNQRTTGQFGLRSDGNYLGVKTGCIAGAPISTTSLSVSYDMSTAASSKLKDFSGNANDCTADGGITIGDTTGTYGGATTFTGNPAGFTCTAISTPSEYTLHLVLKMNTGDSGVTINANSLGLTYMFQNSGTAIECDDGIKTASASGLSTGWHAVDCVFLSTGVLRI